LTNLTRKAEVYRRPASSRAAARQIKAKSTERLNRAGARRRAVVVRDLSAVEHLPEHRLINRRLNQHNRREADTPAASVRGGHGRTGAVGPRSAGCSEHASAMISVWSSNFATGFSSISLISEAAGDSPSYGSIGP
jgi:hypothetical protein